MRPSHDANVHVTAPVARQIGIIDCYHVLLLPLIVLLDADHLTNTTPMGAYNRVVTITYSNESVMNSESSLFTGVRGIEILGSCWSRHARVFFSSAKNSSAIHRDVLFI